MNRKDGERALKYLNGIWEFLVFLIWKYMSRCFWMSWGSFVLCGLIDGRCNNVCRGSLFICF
jgi:hypothetical protein